MSLINLSRESEMDSLNISQIELQIKAKNNVLVLDSMNTRAGTLFDYLAPAILENLGGSFVVTDLNGEIYCMMKDFLEKKGYEVKVFNPLNPEMCKYNPFCYIENEQDADRIIDYIICYSQNDTGLDLVVRLEKFLWKAVFLYVKEYSYNPNIFLIHQLLNEIKISPDSSGKRVRNQFDVRMDILKEKNPEHPAVLAYENVMSADIDMIKQVVSSANCRITYISSSSVLDENDNLTLCNLGKKKMALFCILPDYLERNSPCYYFTKMLYMQLVNKLYDEAGMLPKGRLTEHVTFMSDLFVDVPLPDNILKILTTCHSRNINFLFSVHSINMLKEIFNGESSIFLSSFRVYGFQDDLAK